MRRIITPPLCILAATSLSLTSCGKTEQEALSSRDMAGQAAQVAAAKSDSTTLSSPPSARAPADTPAAPRPAAIVTAKSKPAPRPADKLASHAPMKGPAMAKRRTATTLSSMGAGTTAYQSALSRAYRKDSDLMDPPKNTEDYKDYGINPMTTTAEDRFSTFAVDVDTASYAIARRKILTGQIPPRHAVRVEEFVNYFRYDYAGPRDDRPFAVHMDAAPSPFAPNRHLLRIGVQAKKLSLRERKPSNLVFLVDVSGSMRPPDKLGLAKRALRILVDNLKDGDTVALVTYAGSTRVVLEPTGLEQKTHIVSSIEDLTAGGSTNMGSGLELAYGRAAKNLAPNTISRVIVLSDGDANVGNTGHDQILATIKGKVKEGVTLSTIGFGMGNYKDTMMEQLANKGNGNYYYIDSLNQARRVFQEQLGGTLQVVAKDVKIQVEFDPGSVAHYRLIGYENRNIADRDFRNDRVDAGEIGVGHTVTALYEVELTGKAEKLATVRIRAKKPRGSKATESAYPFGRADLHARFDAASADFRFAAAVMAAAEILRGSRHAAAWKVDEIKAIAASAAEVGDPRANSERNEFLQLLDSLRPLRDQLATR